VLRGEENLTLTAELAAAPPPAKNPAPMPEPNAPGRPLPKQPEPAK
jgi:hypothetical protein